jgi:hypothetical protein
MKTRKKCWAEFATPPETVHAFMQNPRGKKIPKSTQRAKKNGRQCRKKLLKTFRFSTICEDFLTIFHPFRHPFFPHKAYYVK